MLVAMFVLGHLFINFMYDGATGPFQMYALLFITFQAIPYLCTHMLVNTRADPCTGHESGQHDMFNTDSLVVWAENVCFTILRCEFSWIEQPVDNPVESHNDHTDFNMQILGSEKDTYNRSDSCVSV